jgi:hypothetical protein
MTLRVAKNTKNRRLQCACPVAIAILAVVVGCRGRGEEPAPTTTTAEDVFSQRQQFDKLYLTEKSFRRVVRPGNVSAPFVDKETGELCWPALVCTNPECPGRGRDGFPYLFIHNDPLVSVGSNGEPSYPVVGPGEDYSAMVAAAGGFPDPTCPACYEKFRRGRTETQEDISRYASYVHEYELPATAQRREELEQKWKTLGAMAFAPRNSAAADPSAARASEQRAVELAQQIQRPMLKGGIQPEDAALLRQVLKDSDNPQVRVTIVAGLAKARDPDSVPQLLDAMEDESLEMRRLAGNAVELTCGFPHLFQPDAPLEQRRSVIARYRQVWDDLTKTPGQPYIRMMKDPNYKRDLGRRSTAKLKELRKSQEAPGNGAK